MREEHTTELYPTKNYPYRERWMRGDYYFLRLRIHKQIRKYIDSLCAILKDDIYAEDIFKY